MDIKRNVVNWFEIPVADMDRAVRFYETVLGVKMQLQDLGTLKMAFFPMVQQGEGAAGSLMLNENYEPSTKGVLVYISAYSGDLSNELGRVQPAGGEVLREKTQISPEYGYMGLFIDSEGNRIALHSPA